MDPVLNDVCRVSSSTRQSSRPSAVLTWLRVRRSLLAMPPRCQAGSTPAGRSVGHGGAVPCSRWTTGVHGIARSARWWAWRSATRWARPSSSGAGDVRTDRGHGRRRPVRAPAGPGPTTPRWRCAWPSPSSTPAPSTWPTSSAGTWRGAATATCPPPAVLRHRPHHGEPARPLRAHRRARRPRPDQDAAANGSLMRLARCPSAGTATSPRRERAGESSRTTHAADRPVDACRVLGAMVAALIGGEPADEVLAPGFWQWGPLHPAVEAVARGSWAGKEPPGIRGSGYCVDALEAALWAVAGAGDVRDAVLRAANLGDDADTTAAIAGQLAGARWGERGIPLVWLARLRHALPHRVARPPCSGPAGGDAGPPGSTTRSCTRGGSTSTSSPASTRVEGRSGTLGGEARPAARRRHAHLRRPHDPRRPPRRPTRRDWRRRRHHGASTWTGSPRPASPTWASPTTRLRRGSSRTIHEHRPEAACTCTAGAGSAAPAPWSAACSPPTATTRPPRARLAELRPAPARPTAPARRPRSRGT
jgi:hypothetical protein